MSKYAFDLDETLTKPAIKQLANDLFDAGHEVYVVTGGLADSGEWTMPAREERLKELGVKYTSIERVIYPDINQIGRLKGERINELGASLFFDDMDLYLEGVAQTSDVQRVKVL